MNVRQHLINIRLGIELGDALGVPFELMSRREILGANGGRPIDGPAFHLGAVSRIDEMRGLPRGSASDDTQLCDAVAHGLIQAGGYHHELQALLHLRAYQENTAGWGGTTLRSIAELDRHYRALYGADTAPVPSRARARAQWEQAEPRAPEEPARWREHSRGNGVGMKIGLYGAFLGTRGGEDAFESGRALHEIYQLGRLTHADPVCSIAAHALAGIVHDLVRGYSAEGAYLRLKPRLIAAERALETEHRGSERFSHALQEALTLAGSPEALWRFGSEGASDSMTTVPMAIAIWYRHCEDTGPTAAVLEAINAGGDTDTVGSMVGALMGAASDDAEWWPERWTNALLDKGKKARRLGAELSGVATGAMEPMGFDRDDLLRQLGYL